MYLILAPLGSKNKYKEKRGISLLFLFFIDKIKKVWYLGAEEREELTMKRILALVLVLMALTGTVYADTVDLSGMTFNQLLMLRYEIQLALLTNEEFKMASVPQGVWEVGKDIPAGHWSIVADAPYIMVEVCTALDALGKGVDVKNTDFYYYQFLTDSNSEQFDKNTDVDVIDLELKDGFYVIIKGGSVIFESYIGEPMIEFQSMSK